MSESATYLNVLIKIILLCFSHLGLNLSVSLSDLQGAVIGPVHIPIFMSHPENSHLEGLPLNLRFCNCFYVTFDVQVKK